jgi:hypothetical protein
MALVIHIVFDIASHECLPENGSWKKKRADKTRRHWRHSHESFIMGPQFCYVHVEGFAQKQQSEGMYRWLASSFALASYIGRVLF